MVVNLAIERVGGFSFLESPRWHEGFLYASDIYGKRVVRTSGMASFETVLELCDEPSGLGWLPDGQMLVVAMNTNRVLRIGLNGEVEIHADFSRRAQGSLNDMIVADDGVAYIGSFGFDVHAGATFRPSNIYQIFCDGDVATVDGALDFPNGMAFVANYLVVAETMGNRLSSFKISSGQIGPRATWASFGPAPTSVDHMERRREATVVPDGICSDREGCVWVANAAASEVLRVEPGGRVVEMVSTAPLRAYACALGDEDRRTLYVCAAPDSDRMKRGASRDGVLLAARVAVPGNT